MEHTLRDYRYKVVHRNSESDDLEIGGDRYVWIWIDRYPGNYLFGRLARTRFVRAEGFVERYQIRILERDIARNSG